MKKIKRFIKKIIFKSENYWENRYKTGGDSGAGSYNLIADYKASFLNKFIITQNIEKLIDFGCGDGNQASLIKALGYLGLDVSKTAIEICKQKFNGQLNKKFLLYNGDTDKKKKILEYNADLCISFDVIYHLVEDKVFEKYITELFEFSKKYVIIFSTNIDQKCTLHHKNRKFTTYIEKRIKGWDLIEKHKNPHKGADSTADFYLYQKLN